MTIAGVSVGAAAFPNEQPRRFNFSFGLSKAGVAKKVKYRAAERYILITLLKKSKTIMDALVTALDTASSVTIAPDSHVDYGGGAGTSITAMLVDGSLNPSEGNTNAYDIRLTFIKQ